MMHMTIEAKLADLERAVNHDMATTRRAELTEASTQYTRARDAGDADRRRYWSDVLGRVQRGERLIDARRVEAEHRNGPVRMVYFNGQPLPERDLDVWRVQ